MFNQIHKTPENNTAALIITFYHTKDTIIRVIIGLSGKHGQHGHGQRGHGHVKNTTKSNQSEK